MQSGRQHQIVAGDGPGRRRRWRDGTACRRPARCARPDTAARPCRRCASIWPSSANMKPWLSMMPVEGESSAPTQANSGSSAWAALAPSGSRSVTPFLAAVSLMAASFGSWLAAVDPGAVEPHPAGIRRVEIHDGVEHRGLAGAIGPDHAMDALLLDGEIEPVDGSQAAEPLGHLLGLEEDLGRHAFATSRCSSASTSCLSCCSARISRRFAADGHRPSGFSRITAMIARP